MIGELKNTILACALWAGLLHTQVYGQDQALADSLAAIVSVENNLSNSDLCNLYLDIAYNSTHPDDRITFAEKALKSAEKVSDSKLIAASLRYKGNGLRSKGQLSEAIGVYLEAARYIEGSQNSGDIGVIYVDLADLYAIQNNFNTSKKYYLQSIEAFKLQKDSIKLASALLNTGELFRAEKKYDSAIVFFQRSKSIFNTINHPVASAYNLGNIGLVMAEQGRHAQAEKNINDALEILQAVGHHSAISVYQKSLADIYEERGEYEQALKYARKSLSLGAAHDLKEQIRDASLKLSELYKLAGDSDEAYVYLKQYITYRDSINNEETIRKMADLRTEYEVNKKQIEVDLLSEQAKLNRIITWSAIFIIALLLVLTMALLKIYRIKDRAVRIVRQRRRVIADQRNKLDEVNKTKDRFFSIISHDIRGPINNFQGISVLINSLADSEDVDGLRQLGSMMEDSAKEVSSLLDNLLEWALSQEGKIPYHAEPISLRELCQTNLAIMLNMALAKQVDLTGDSLVDVKVFADKNSVSTIIRNLLSNAIKFTPEKGTVELKIEEVNGEGLITVKDNGIGIPQDKLDNLFSLKGERSRWGTKGEKGIGLGLMLVHEFVELNHGRIEVESEEGIGTTFKVILPMHVAVDQPITNEK